MTATIQGTESLYDGLYKLDRVTLEQERRDGTRETITREVFRPGDGAAVLPVDPGRGTVLLVRQLRAPAMVNGDGPELVEAIAGMVEGDTPEQAARKEAEQEAGVRLHALRPLHPLYPSPGASAERVHLFLAEYGEADRAGAGGGLPSEGENIEVLEMPLADAAAMLRRGEIVDMKTAVLLQAALLGEGPGTSA